MQTLLVLLPVLQHSDVKTAYHPITTVNSCLPKLCASEYADLERSIAVYHYHE